MSNKKILATAFAFAVIANFIISFSFFSYLSDTSEVAGALIAFFAKIKMSVSALFCSAIAVALLGVLLKIFKTDYNKIVPLGMLVFGASFYLNQKLCDYAYYESKPHTKSDDEVKGIKDGYCKENKIQLRKMFAKAELFSPPLNEKIKDKLKLLNGIKTFLNFYNYGNHHKTIEDSIKGSQYLTNINSLFKMWYGPTDTTEFKIIADSLDIGFMTYSPDYKYFISVFTFKKSLKYDPVFCYWAGMVLCERTKDSLICHTLSAATPQDGDYTREGAFWSGMRGLSYFGYTYGLHDQHAKCENPSQKAFWTSPIFFKPIKTAKGIMPRYQVQGIYNSKEYEPRLSIIIK